jgi:Family of unknown function (DUF6278)
MIWKRRRRGTRPSDVVILRPVGGPADWSSEELGETMALGFEELGGRGVTLDGSVASLRLLDEAIDDWPADAAARLGSGVGAYLGTVLVNAGAKWRTCPDGRPIIRLASGRELDVIDLACRRLTKGAPRLDELVRTAL